MSKLFLLACAFCVLAIAGLPLTAVSAEQEAVTMDDNAVVLALNSLVRIKSEKEGKVPFFVYQGEGPWQLYAADDVNGFDFTTPTLSGDGPGAFPVPVKPGRHYVYALRSGDALIVFAEERLPVSGGYNFRDLGGIPAKDGRLTVWGRLFRADDLSRLSAEDLTYLESIPLRTVVDLRSLDGEKRSPDILPSTVDRYAHLPLVPGDLDPRGPEAQAGEPVDWDAFMVRINSELVRNPEHIKVYRQFFALVQQEERLPLLFHCAAGKDRTGLAAAYILFSLGVSKEEVLKNYLASAYYLQGKYDRLIAEDPSRAPLFTVKPEYLQAAIDAMERHSGSIEKYLVQVLGVDVQKMRRLFLQ